MPFVPVGGDHAVIEVVFTLVVNREWHQHEIQQVRNHHQAFKSHLPKATDGQDMQFTFAPNGQPVGSTTFPTVAFERFREDGTLSWRLMLQGNQAFVNCLIYTGWEEVWKISKERLSDVQTALIGTDARITNVQLQYINEFDWKGSIDSYSLQGLLNMEGDHLPKSLARRGSLWHCNTGWFEKGAGPLKGQMLSRCDMAGMHRDQQERFVRIDTVRRMDFKSHQSFNDVGDANGWLDMTFRELHLSCKDHLASTLAQPAKNNIGLG